jgi:hypothetical protein
MFEERPEGLGDPKYAEELSSCRQSLQQPDHSRGLPDPIVSWSRRPNEGQQNNLGDGAIDLEQAVLDDVKEQFGPTPRRDLGAANDDRKRSHIGPSI